jgi:hypothetical protein
MNAAYDLETLNLTRAYVDCYLAYRRYVLGLPLDPPTDARPTPRAQWEAAIAERTARGMPRYQAIVDIGRTDRTLFETYNKEATSGS